MMVMKNRSELNAQLSSALRSALRSELKPKKGFPREFRAPCESIRSQLASLVTNENSPAMTAILASCAIVVSV